MNITEQQARESLNFIDNVVASQQWPRNGHAKAQEYVMNLVMLVNEHFVKEPEQMPAKAENGKDAPG